LAQTAYNASTKRANGGLKLATYLLCLGGIFSEESLLKHSAISPAANRWQAGLIEALNGLGLPAVLLSHLPEPLWLRGRCWPGSPGVLDPRFEPLVASISNMPELFQVLKTKGIKGFHWPGIGILPHTTGGVVSAL